MRLISLIVMLLLSNIAYAINIYNLEVDVYVNDKHVSAPKLLVGEKRSATIVQESELGKSFIDFKIISMKNKKVELEYETGKLDLSGKKSELIKKQLHLMAGKDLSENLPGTIFNAPYRIKIKVTKHVNK